MTASRSPISSATSSKHNEANGEDNRDGSDDNDSTNCGVEGPTDDPEILQLRRQLRRNQLASLMLAQGVPLLLAGDEVGNSQSGNNNAYCQDNEIGWVDWSGARPRRRRHDRAWSRSSPTAPPLSAAAPAPLGGRPPRRRLLRRPLADAAGDRDDRAGLEFSGRALPLLRAGAARRPAAPALHRAQCRAGSDRIHAADYAASTAPGPRSSTQRRSATLGQNLPAGAEIASPGAFRPCLFGREMNATTHLRATLHADGVTFRLWAPAAKRVELVLERRASACRRAATAGMRADRRRGRRHALQVPHRWRDRGARPRLAFPAGGCVRTERGHRP